MAYASSPVSINYLSPVTVGNPSSGLIPSAESVHSTEAMGLPPDLDAFIILIANEAHESW